MLNEKTDFKKGIQMEDNSKKQIIERTTKCKFCLWFIDHYSKAFYYVDHKRM